MYILNSDVSILGSDVPKQDGSTLNCYVYILSSDMSALGCYVYILGRNASALGCYVYILGRDVSPLGCTCTYWVMMSQH